MIELYDLVNTAVFVVLAFLFINIFMDVRNKSQLSRIVIIVGWIVIEILLVKVFDDSYILRAVFTILCTSVFSFVLFSCKGIKLILFAFLEYAFNMAFEFLAYLLAIRFVGYVDIYEINANIAGVYGGVVSQILILIAIIVLNHIYKKRKYKYANVIDLCKYLMFPFVSLSMIVLFSYMSSGNEITTQEINSYIYLAIVFLFSNLYMYWMLKVDLDHKLEKEKIKIESEFAEQLSTLYKQISAEHKVIAGIEHEYKNNLVTINALVAARKYENLEKYLSENTIVPVISDVVDTGNSIVSAVFNAKYAEALRNDIKVRFDINNLEGLPVKDTDLVIILSNLFNNAIEACMNLETNRNIDVKINRINGLLFLSFSNSYTSSLKNVTSNKDIIDTNRHGFGLSNIRSIVKFYDGQMDIETVNQMFSVRIIIPE
ncbi:MAG: GHKL domain-containing protein [Clostridia bacterium]|nr:GHKL domain-containing protein [Clostridia bacterium]